MDRRFFSDRMPHLHGHRRDQKTFVWKLRHALSQYHASDITRVLANLLCESLGEEPVMAYKLFKRKYRSNLHKDVSILAGGGSHVINRTVRSTLREHVELPDWVTEVNDVYQLDRIAFLSASAVVTFIKRQRLPDSQLLLEELRDQGVPAVRVLATRPEVIVEIVRKDGTLGRARILP